MVAKVVGVVVGVGSGKVRNSSSEKLSMSGANG